MDKKARATMAMQELQTNFPLSKSNRKAPYFFPTSPNRSKLAAFERRPFRSSATNCLSIRKMMPPSNPQTCALGEQNLQLLQPIEIIFPKAKASSSQDRRFPQRTYMKTPAQIMMQVRQLRKEAWKEVTADMSFVEKIEVRQPICEYRVPQRKVRSENRSRQSRSRSLINRNISRRDSLQNSQRLSQSQHNSFRPYDDLRLEGWSTINNHSCLITGSGDSQQRS